MIEIRDLEKIYVGEKGQRVFALDRVSLRFPSKGLVFIVGRSGCGKSTLLHILGGLEPPSAGEVIVEGRSTKHFSRRDLDDYRNHRVGFVFQEFHMLEEFSVRENVALALALQGVLASDAQVEEVLERVGMAGYGDRRPNELSGGQKQRVAIARCLIKNPPILLADEPTGALDSQTGEQILTLLQELSREKLVLVVSHDRDFAARYADRIVELSDGRVIGDSDAENEDVCEMTEEDDPPRRRERARLSLRHAVRMGLHGLFYKKLRLVATVLLCAMAFSLFGVVSTMASYDRERVLVDSVLDAQISYAMLAPIETLTSYRGQEVVNVQRRAVGMSAAQLVTLQQKTGLSFYPVFNGATASNAARDMQSFAFSFENLKQSKETTQAFDGYLYGFTPLDASAVEAFGYTLTGRMPQKNGEIVITEFVYRQFKTCGFQNTRFGESVEADELNMTEGDASSILGKHFTVYTSSNMAFTLGGDRGKLPKYDYTIVGVLDTGFDYERYASFLPGGSPAADGDLVDTLLLEELKEALACSPHTLGILSVGDIATMAQDVVTRAGGYGQREPDLPWASIDLMMQYPTVDAVNGISSFHSEKTMTQMEVLWLDGRKRDALADDEIVISSALLSYRIPLDYAPILQKIYEVVGEACWELTEVTDTYYVRVARAAVLRYVQEHLEEYRDVLQTTWGALPDAILGEKWANALYEQRQLSPFAQSATGEAVIGAAMDALLPTLCAFFRLDTSYPINAEMRKAVLLALVQMYDEKIVDKKSASAAPLSSKDTSAENMHLWTVAQLESVYCGYYAALELSQAELWRDEAFLRYIYTVSGYSETQWEGFTEARRLEIATAHYAEYLYRIGADKNLYGTLNAFSLRLEAFCQLCRIAGVGDESVLYRDIALSCRAYPGGTWQPSAAFQNTLSACRFRVVGVYDANLYAGSAVQDRLMQAVQTELIEQELSWNADSVKESGHWCYALGAMPQKREAVEALVALESEESDLAFVLKNQVVSTLDAVGNDVQDITFYISFVALGFLLFAGLLMATLIGTSVAYKQKDIGILRALGAGSGDVYRVFFAEAGVLAMLGALPAVLVSIVATWLINRGAHLAGVRLSLLHFGPVQLLALLAVAVLSALLAAVLPIWRMNTLSPAALIRGK